MKGEVVLRQIFYPTSFCMLYRCKSITAPPSTMVVQKSLTSIASDVLLNTQSRPSQRQIMIYAEVQGCSLPDASAAWHWLS
jgi:hypothetical protein